MHKGVPTVGILFSYAALQTFANGGSAVSPEAKAVSKAATAVVESMERSHVLFGEKSAVLSQLRALADDTEALEIHPFALLWAEVFLRALPSAVPLPELAVEPDGSISFDWIQSRTRLFSLSLGSNRRLAYAWIDGTDRGHGVVTFDGERIPQKILQGINSI